MKNIVSLNQNKRFKYIYHKGKSMVSPLVVTYVVKNKLDYNRIGITASKKIGNAVERNRARRVIRAAYIQCKDDLSFGYDIVFVARAKVVSAKSTQVQHLMSKHLLKLGLKN